MNLTITVKDEYEAALKERALASGFSEAGFVEKVLEQALEPVVQRVEDRGPETEKKAARPLAERIREIWSDMTDEERAEYPEGGAYQIDHHVYGLPKR